MTELIRHGGIMPLVGSRGHTMDIMIDRLRSLWAHILEQSPDDILEDDVFFELGGDSITALRLYTAARKQGILLTMEQIYTHASLKDLAQQASPIEVSDASLDAVTESPKLEPFELLSTERLSREEQILLLARECTVSAARVENAYPLTPMQEALMAASNGNENLYLRQLVYQLADDVSLHHLQAAWASTIRNNPLLRTRVCHTENMGYIQAVIDQDDAPWAFAGDLSAFLQQDMQSPMRIGNPFFRYTVVTEGQTRYFVWSVHHSLCDGATILDIQDEVSRRFRNEPTSTRPPFDLFVSKVLATSSNKEEEFWTRSLSDVNVTPYPPELPDNQVQANSSSTLKQVVEIQNSWPSGLPKALLLRAAWAVLLSHHTGSHEVVFGTIVSGRASPAFTDVSQTAGPTINLLPIAIQVDPKDSISSFIAKVRNQAGQMAEYEHTGISSIRRYLAMAGGPGSTSACDFRNLFVVQPLDFNEAAAPSLNRVGLQYVPGLGKLEYHRYPLVVSASLSSSEANVVGIMMQYDKRVISKTHVQNLINQFQAVLAHICNADQGSLLSTISPLNGHDLEQIRQWNQPAPPVKEMCFHWQFQKTVHRQPGAAAVCYSTGSSLTYAEVENLSSSLALRLIDLGIGPEKFVIICFEKSIWTIVAMLAVFKAGGAFVPIDPEHPLGRIAEVREAVRTNVALTSSAASGVLRGLCDHVIPVDDSPLTYIPRGARDLFGRAKPSNTAYVLFTSGSTGKPKGVMMAHSALCASIISHGRALGAGAHWRVLQFSSHTFDASIAEFFTTLAFGGCICVPRDHGRMNDLAGEIVSMNVNTALLTPTVANLLQPEDVPSLRMIVLGGEPVTKETLVRWGGKVELVNGYGPTETCVYCSINPNMVADTNPAHIGRSVGGTMWIADPENHEMLSAIGCIGEILVSGSTVAKGYYGNEAITEASFKPVPDWLKRLDPTTKPTDRIYKTGDLARYTSDGIVQIIGRKDTQIKLRGIRIELGEIESRIMDKGSATAAIAMVPVKGPCTRQIVAVISFNKVREAANGNDKMQGISYNVGDIQPSDDILKSLKARLTFSLPDYMLPTVWVVLRKIPVLVSGKIDRKTIKSSIEHMSQEMYHQLVGDIDKEKEGEEDELSGETPGNKLRQIWSDVLNIPQARIAMGTSFFSLGGDSISAIQIVSKAKQEGMHLSVRDILRNRTLGSVLQHIIESQSNETSSLGLLHQLQTPMQHDGSFNLSPIQRLFIESNNSKSHVARFHQALLLRLRRPASTATIRDAFSAVVERHAMLRTVFLSEDAYKKQKNLENTLESYRFESHLGQLSTSEFNRVLSNAHNKISIVTGPVFSVDLFEKTDGVARLLVMAHHLVIDLVSWRILLQDVQDYIERGRFSTPATLSFHQWTKALEAVSSKDGPSDKEIRPKTRFESETGPLGFQLSQNTYSDTQEIQWHLDRPDTNELLALASSDVSAEPVELMIAAIAASFTQTFNEVCPSLFVEGHGREPPSGSGIDLSSTVGWFTVMYPIEKFPIKTNAVRLTEYLQHVQAARKDHPDNGLEYFSRTMLRDQNMAGKLMSRLIQFNYHGKYQQFEGENSIFALDHHPDLEKSLIGPEVQRSSVFEIEAAIRHEKLHFSLTFPGHLPCKELVKDWFYLIKQNLEELPTILHSEGRHPLPTPPAPFVFPPGTGADERKTHYEALLQSPFGGKESIRVEDAYPCSPMQRYMLKEQATNPSMFLLSWDFEMSSVTGQPLSLDQIIRAWHHVIAKHSILRTAFFQDPTGKCPPIQLIIAGAEPDVRSSLTTFDEVEPIRFDKCILPHRARFFQSGDKLCGHIELSHTLIDGWSLGIIKSDILAAYDANSMTLTPEPAVIPYKAFITAHIQETVDADAKYWLSTLADQTPTLLSLPHTLPNGEKVKASGKLLAKRNVSLLPAFCLRSLAAFSAKHGVTIASIIDAAWAQTLSICTESPDVCFAYVISGRETALDGVLEIVGPLINVLMHHLRVKPPQDNSDQAAGLVQLAYEIQEQRNVDGAHTLCGIQEVLESSGLAMKSLTNTAVNFQRRPLAVGNGNLNIRDLDSSRDPWPFEVLLRVVVDDDLIRPQIEFDTQVLDLSSIDLMSNIFWERIQIALSAANTSSNIIKHV